MINAMTVTIIAYTSQKQTRVLSLNITGSDSKSTLLHLEIKGVLWVMQPLSSEMSVSARDDIPI